MITAFSAVKRDGPRRCRCPRRHSRQSPPWEKRWPGDVPLIPVLTRLVAKRAPLAWLTAGK
ncbi:hypothetical protein KCP76_13365 [Salmonella enterica subsp. enterica serovar Weltevreden]|nr:hypothetical protein KCP76_13365 [Salmonella enterica subsp. enterica serovar Weltevreden]